VKLGHAPRAARPRSLDDALLPLVNVVFLLMVFFLSAGRFGAPRPEAATPESARAEARATAARVLELRADGLLASGGDVFAETDLAARAIAWQGQPLDVKATGKVPAARVLRLLTVLRGVGVREVRLLTVKGGS
jgi:biopolymer transport protein ExbD